MNNSLLVEIFHLQSLPEGDFSVWGKPKGVYLSEGPDVKTPSPSKHLVLEGDAGVADGHRTQRA